MQKKLYAKLCAFIVLLFGLAPVSNAAGYQPVTLTASSYNADIIANGVGAATSSTTANADAGSPGYAFLSADFKAVAGNAAPTYSLPQNGFITNLVAGQPNYQLADYSANNSLRLLATASGTLTFATAKYASEVYVLAVSGSGQSIATFTVNFSDGSSQVFANQTINDWYNGTGYAAYGFGRVRLSDNVLEGEATNPRMYQLKLTISSSNYSKQITSITVAKTSPATTTVSLCVMAVSINELAPCATPTANPTALVLTPGVANLSGSFTAASPAPDKYLVVRSAGALVGSPVNTVAYTVGQTLGNGTVIAIGTATTFTDNGLTAATSYTYTIFPINDLCSVGPLYNVASPLTGTVSTNTQKTYVWNGSSGTDWQVAANWTPVRTYPDSTDFIVFNNGSPANLVTNIATQKISRLTFSNNTTAAFQSSSTAVLTIFSDNSAATDELNIGAGSSLILYSDNSLTLAFGGTGGTVTVTGNLEASTNNGTAIVNFMNFTNTITTIASTGTLTVGGTVGGNANATVVTSTAANLIINGTYNHTYTTSSGSGVPIATWATGSTCAFVGYTTATGGPNGGGSAQTFYNVTYNCPAQTSASQWSAEFAGTITGTFTVISTGTGSWGIANTQTTTKNINNFVQTGGTVDLGTGTSGTKIYNFSGTFNQTGGVLKSTGTIALTINFNGTAAQNVNFADAAPVGPIVYQVSNPTGINLTGSGALTSAFNINTTGGVTVSTTAANPINTTLVFNYAATATTLNYAATGNTTATASLLPATGSPFNLTVNVGAGNALSIPFSRTIGGTLNLSSGDVDIATNNLTLGTSTTAIGTLSGSGNIRVTTGTFIRWFGTTGLPTTVGNATGSFPLAYGTVNRNVSLYFSAATALSTGGTISVGHTNASGTSAVSVTDAAYTIDKRLNSYWTFNTGNSIAASGTIAARVTGGNLFASSTIANVRLMKAAAVAGTHVAGTGVYPAAQALRSGLAIADLTSTNYYVGAATADINTAIFTAIATGNWSTGTTWDQAVAPGSSDIAVIGPGVTVTADATANIAGNFTVNGTLNVPASSTITLSDVVTNNGTINITGGTVKVGPDGGGNKSFTNNATVTVSSGTLTINGNLNNIAGSTFNQSGGAIVVDGNAAANAANSVASGTAIVSFKSSNLGLTGGTFTIPDPHANTTASNTFEFTGTTAVNIPATHTFVFGNGVSTDAGGNATNAFRINPGTTKISFGNVIVNTGTPTNSFVSQSSAFGINGNLTINAGGEVRNSSGIYLTGNLINNGTFTSTLNTLYFGTYLGGVYGNGTAAQTVSGTGVFRNSATTSTANFYALNVKNGNGVTFSIGDVVFSNFVTFNAAVTPSLLFTTAGAKFIEIAGAGVTAASATNGWFACKYQKAAGAGGILNSYNIGDATNFTPVTVGGTTATTVLTAGNIAVQSIAGDHPQIATSGLIANKNVNRYFKVETGGGITFSPGTVTLNVNWVAADVDATATPASFKAAAYTSAWTSYPVTTPTATGITVTGLDATLVGEFQIGELVAVPVKVSSFTGRLTSDASAELKWTVETMTNFSHFELQRSSNGTSFSTIATLAAAGSAYTYNDQKLLDGYNYYRLKMVDKDGTSDYSKIVTLKAKGRQLEIAAIMPTVTTGTAIVKIAATKETKATLQIVDAWGRVVMTNIQTIGNGITNVPLDLNRFAAGVYTVQIITADEAVSQRLIKQ